MLITRVNAISTETICFVFMVDELINWLYILYYMFIKINYINDDVTNEL